MIAALLAALALTAAPSRPGAADAPARPAAGDAPEDILPLSQLEDDPIGVDERSRSLDRVPRERKPDDAEAQAERARFGPLPPRFTARAGEIMNAVQSVRERQHRVRVRLDDGLATVDVEQRFENRSGKPAELEYRLAVPEGSGLAAFQVCNPDGCREGTAAGAAGLAAYDASVLARGHEPPLPIGHVALQRDRRGEAALLRLAPVRKGAPLTVKLRYVAPLAQHGAEAQLTIPARGMDARVAPSEVSVEAGALSDARIGRSPAGAAPALLDPWSPVIVGATDRQGGGARVHVVRHRCGGERCVRAHVAAPPRPLRPRELVIALDVSPSTEGPARGRLVSALGALLEAAPPGTRVRALAFAARAEVLVADALEPGAVSLRPFARAVGSAELGSATRFEAVWEHARGWLGGRKARRGAGKPLIVLLGDGGLTRGDGDALASARRAGVEVSVVNLAARRTVPELLARVHRTGGVALEVGLSGAATDDRRLTGMLGALFAPTVARDVRVVGARWGGELGPLKAGESLTWQGPVTGSAALRVGGRRVPARPASAELATALAAAADLRAGRTPPALAAVDRRDLASPAGDWPATRPGTKRCDRRGPARRHGGISSDERPVAVARERVCVAPATATVGGDGQIGVGMPAEPLLQMLRRRIIPVARGCFRRDRAGRAAYDRRAVFAFTLAEREIVDARVEGRIAPELRRCLLGAVDTLDVPRFSGVVKVRYPLVTESIEGPAKIDLTTGTAGEVDALFGAEPTR